MVGIFKAAGVALLFLFSTVVSSDPVEEDPPQLLYNGTFILAESSSGSSSSSLNNRGWSALNLFQRDYLTCPTGYRSCSSGYCAEIGGHCCTIGTCPSGYNCCGTAGRCSPIGAQCCGDGYYCLAGTLCRIRSGRKVCCPPGGCARDYSVGSLGDSLSEGDVTSVTNSAAPTITLSRTRYSYYSTTYYWTYWWYFWTTTYPYSEKTVTSTRTSTRTVWSVYETALSEARSSFSRSIESYTFSTPYSATYLKSSTSAVPLNTASSTSATATSSSVADSAPNPAGEANDFTGRVDVASGVSVNLLLVWACAFIAVAIGGLAVGL